MAFNFKDKLEQAKQLLAVAPLLAEGLKEQAKQKFGELSDSAHEKVETGRAVVEQVRAVAPIVIAMKKEEYKGKLGNLAERFGLSAGKPAQQKDPSEAELEAFLKSLGAEAPAEAAQEEEHEAPAAAEPVAAAPANDAAPKAKKPGSKKKKAASTRKPK